MLWMVNFFLILAECLVPATAVVSVLWLGIGVALGKGSLISFGFQSIETDCLFR